jgi:hypothetical protein
MGELRREGEPSSTPSSGSLADASGASRSDDAPLADESPCRELGGNIEQIRSDAKVGRMRVAGLIRWQMDSSPGLQTLRTGVLALSGAVVVTLATLQLERMIWPHGESLEAWHGLDVLIFLLIIFLGLLGLICIPLGTVLLIRERLKRES